MATGLQEPGRDHSLLMSSWFTKACVGQKWSHHGTALCHQDIRLKNKIQGGERLLPTESHGDRLGNSSFPILQILFFSVKVCAEELSFNSTTLLYCPLPRNISKINSWFVMEKCWTHSSCLVHCFCSWLSSWYLLMPYLVPKVAFYALTRKLDILHFNRFLFKSLSQTSPVWVRQKHGGQNKLTIIKWHSNLETLQQSKQNQKLQH